MPRPIKTLTRVQAKEFVRLEAIRDLKIRNEKNKVLREANYRLLGIKNKDIITIDNAFEQLLKRLGKPDEVNLSLIKYSDIYSHVRAKY